MQPRKMQPRRHEDTKKNELFFVLSCLRGPGMKKNQLFFVFSCLRGQGSTALANRSMRGALQWRGMSQAEHKAHAPSRVRCFIVTVSDTRTEETDRSGRAIADLLTAAGHEVAGRAIVKDDPDLVRGTIERQLATPGIQVIIATGGTGITSRDSTYEAIGALLQKRLDGFGELFRMLSFEQIGPAAMMSRASAGLAAGRILVSLPGSEAAVRLAMERLLIPELGHLVQQAAR
jgi:molybdenum cofactor biosynthesis protein B